ncbi:hypothetical protein HOLleu_42670 [Holothuria leucospilota]|uniref:Uncharacterized protein n=1 Tax=Holothuria leucospilota TaxID=206669 RepID=A0A9Q1BBH9_HOLLE|nr:hypothetical protein HOLleu_42670 [Holothuria leucospilota]
MAPPRRLKKHAHELRFLAKCSPHQRKALLRHADESLITSLCECVSNVVKGNVPVSKAQRSKLARYKKHLRALGDKRLSRPKRRDILVQQGGFLSVLLKPIVQSLDGDMKTTLEREDLSLYEKIELYNQTLQRYLDADKQRANKPIGIKITNTPSDKQKGKDDNDDATLTPKEAPAMKSDLLLANFPKSLKGKAKLLLERISDHRQSENPVIDWNAKGELLYQGETIHGSNLTDLILDVMHSRKDFNPIGWQQFIHGLADLNFPEAYVGNLMRRQTMHQIREKGPRRDFSKLLPTPPRDERPRGKGNGKSSKRKKITWESF